MPGDLDDTLNDAEKIAVSDLVTGVDLALGEASASGAGPARLTEVGPLKESDRVPQFRKDLRIRRQESGGTFEVEDPVADRTFLLYEFEVSIARMLNGQRLASEVVRAGGRLGIPITLEGLEKFLRQLVAYKFLLDPDAQQANEFEPPDGGQPTRERWDEATRSLYQSGMRLMRQGRHKDAQGYFEAILDAEPENPEAMEMLALIARGEDMTAAPLGLAPRPEERAEGNDGGARRGARGRGPTVVMLGVGIAVGFVAAWLIVTTALAPEIAAPPPSVVQQAPAPPPGASPAPVQPEMAAALAPPATVALPTTVAAKVTTGASVVKVKAASAGALVWKRATGITVIKNEVIGVLKVAAGKAPPEHAAALAKVAELEKLAKDDPIYLDFLESAREKERNLRRSAAEAREIAAPAAGNFYPVAAKGSAVKAGQLLAKIRVPGATVITARVAVSGIGEGWLCELHGPKPGQAAACALIEVHPVEGGQEVTAHLRGPPPPWSSKPCKLTLTPPNAKP